MSDKFTYTPQNVCSREYEIEVDGDTIVSLQIRGGCPGNTQGVSKLAVGRKLDDVISLLDGIKCPGSKTKDTSCPDQIAKALKEYKRQSA